MNKKTKKKHKKAFGKFSVKIMIPKEVPAFIKKCEESGLLKEIEEALFSTKVSQEKRD